MDFLVRFINNLEWLPKVKFFSKKKNNTKKNSLEIFSNKFIMKISFNGLFDNTRINLIGARRKKWSDFSQMTKPNSVKDKTKNFSLDNKNEFLVKNKIFSKKETIENHSFFIKKNINKKGVTDRPVL